MQVAEKEHWWWDSIAANDGDALNDAVMRHFYADCIASTENHDHDAGLLETGDGIEEVDRELPSVCYHNYTMAMVNPATHLGLCGLRLLQQFQSMQMSTIRVSCATANANVDAGMWLGQETYACAIASGDNVMFGDCPFPVTQSWHKVVWLQSMECS